MKLLFAKAFLFLDGFAPNVAHSISVTYLSILITTYKPAILDNNYGSCETMNFRLGMSYHVNGHNSFTIHPISTKLPLIYYVVIVLNKSHWLIFLQPLTNCFSIQCHLFLLVILHMNTLFVIRKWKGCIIYNPPNTHVRLAILVTPPSTLILVQQSSRVAS